ncbi:ABC transporter ATP-binding protein [Marinibaculum pumilum]|uniref:ABC transporter ATP-binding protein n=1 Tax=Marinibaculum pumilum TaxID=1766165 RepID=A0ABV7L9V5_9PROT
MQGLTEESDAPQPVLRLRGITKRFGAVTANDGIDLDLHAGRILALLGENGAGKTTLMNILFGHYAADEGSVEVAGPDGGLQPLRPGAPEAALAAGIGMVHQHFTLADNLTVLDNIVLGTERLWLPFQRRRAAQAKLRDLMARAGLQVPLDANVGSLSVGERQRVEILKALYRDARILILDEPTAVLTPGEADRLFDTLRQLAAAGLAIVFISHKLAEVMALTERVVVLRGGRAVASFRTAETSREALAECMVGRPVQAVERPPLEPGQVLLRIAGADVPGRHGRPGLDGADLEIRGREIVGIAGVSGNGQGALSDLLCGLARPTAGTVALFDRPAPLSDPAAMVAAGVGRIPEDRHHDGTVGDMAVWENAALETVRQPPVGRHGLLDRAAGRRHAIDLIARYNVRCPGPDAPIRLLSGGNMQKLILGRVLERQPRLIVANQPTRGLDIGAVTEVHRRLLEARAGGAGILLISEDLDELLALADRIAVLYHGRLSEALPADGLDVRTLGLMMAGQRPDHAAPEPRHAP